MKFQVYQNFKEMHKNLSVRTTKPCFKNLVVAGLYFENFDLSDLLSWQKFQYRLVYWNFCQPNDLIKFEPSEFLESNRTGINYCYKHS